MNSTKKIMTDAQREFLVKHCNRLSDRSIAEALEVSETKARNWRLELGLERNQRNRTVTRFSTDGEQYFVHDPNLATI